MIDYSKKSQEHLFLIFLLGGIKGIIDGDIITLGYFIGSGVGLIIISLPLGYLLDFILSQFSSEEKNLDDGLLDSELEENKKEKLERAIKNRLKPFKYGIYISLILLLLEIHEELSRVVF